MKVTLACRLFGHCRQAFYQSKADIPSEVRRNRLLLESVREIRREDPGIGGYKLWVMLTALFGRNSVPGRDSFYALLRRNHLMLPPRKSRCTTNSNHRFRKWKNLTKGLVPTAANQLWVADITYVELKGGEVCYLHLLTDAYSRKIIGWVLADTLRAAASMQALESAIRQAAGERGGNHLEGLVHHSDRGVQYCCDCYVSLLQEYKISISMTEDYNPTENAIAERVNGIIKTECVYRRERFNNIGHARDVIGRYIHFYNHRRPHMSIGNKVPALVHLEQGEQKNMWERQKKVANKPQCGGNVV